MWNHFACISGKIIKLVQNKRSTGKIVGKLPEKYLTVKSNHTEKIRLREDMEPSSGESFGKG